MLTLQSSLFAVALSVCLICSFLAARRGSRLRVRYFGGYLALEAAGFLLEWMMLHPTTPLKSLWLGLLMGVSLLVAPCLWMLARELTEPERPMIRRLDRGHWLPIVTGWLFILPLLLRAHLGSTFSNADDVATGSERMLIHVAMLVSIVLFAVQVPFYLWRIYRILQQRIEGTRALFANLDNEPLNALRLLVVVVATNWLVSLMRTFHCLLLGEDFGLGLVFTSAEVAATVLALLAVINHSLPLNGNDRVLLTEIETDAAKTRSAYSKSALSASDSQRIADKLVGALSEQQLYLDSDINLRRLSTAIGENPRYVSQVISETLQTRFYDLINHYRVEAVARALLSDQDASITDLVANAGFNSKSTFHTAFRRHFGLTPTQYRTQNRFEPAGPDALNAG